MRKKTTHLCILFLLLTITAFAQQRKTILIDTTIQKIYNGTLKADYLKTDTGNYILDGQISFESKNKLNWADSSFGIETMAFKGSIKEEQVNGKWEYNQKKFYFNQPIFQIKSDATVKFPLNGIEKSYEITFSKGKRDGRWLHKSTQYQKGRETKSETNAFVNYQSDLLSGLFVYKFETTEYGKVAITGKTNKSGFFDGDIFLEYDLEDKRIKEIRKYEDGYLLMIKTLNSKQNEVVEAINYSDVSALLETLKKETKTESTYRKSQSGFGVEFNNGYAAEDKRILIQKNGNKILTKALGMFDTIISPNDSTPKSFSHQLTRRFKYVYPQVEDSVAQKLLTQTNVILKNVKELLKQANFELRKSSTDTLAIHYAWLQHTNNKLVSIEQELSKFNSDYFDFKKRNIYYDKGFSAFKKLDSIKYEVGKKQFIIPYKPEITISNYAQFLPNIDTYLTTIEAALPNIQKVVDQKLINFKNQEEIDRIDKMIILLDDSINKLYKDFSNYYKNNKFTADAPFAYKVLKSTNERLLEPLKDAYLKNTKTYEEAVEIGQKIICKQQFLLVEKPNLNQIKWLQKQINDSLFIVYRDNPFDNRKLETSILGGIQVTSNLLLSHFANNIINAKNCEEMKENMQNIGQLRAKLQEYVANYQQAYVQDLNRTLKRERVPQRIKRIMEL